jgi:Domain of unknown function (DUF4340)
VAATPALMSDSPPSHSDASPPKGSARGPLVLRWRLNLALLIVIAGLGTFAWYRSGHEPKANKPSLTAVKATAVQKIEITRPQHPAVQLERRDGNWRLTAPIAARADSLAVNSLLRALQAPVALKGGITSTGADLARYGLEPPKLTLRFDAATIEFGERHPLKDERYVKYGSAVQLIPDQYYTQAAVPYANLIDSRLIEPGRKLVSIKLPDFALTLKDGVWERTPEIKALSSDRINAFVDEWQHARALQVKPHSDKKPVEETVTLEFEQPGGSKSDLTIGVIAREPELVLYREDENLEYHFPQDTDQRLLKLNEK